MTSNPKADTQAGGPDDQDTILILSRDLFFGMRVRTAVKQLGFSLTIAKDEAETIAALAQGSPVLALIDFNQPVEWSALAPLMTANLAVIAFGSHTDVEGFRAAKVAGVNRVVSNGEFSRTLPDLIAKYRSS
jgi:CheY-like chemotaxis protein